MATWWERRHYTSAATSDHWDSERHSCFRRVQSVSTTSIGKTTTISFHLPAEGERRRSRRLMVEDEVAWFDRRRRPKWNRSTRSDSFLKIRFLAEDTSSLIFFNCSSSTRFLDRCSSTMSANSFGWPDLMWFSHSRLLRLNDVRHDTHV